MNPDFQSMPGVPNGSRGNRFFYLKVVFFVVTFILLAVFLYLLLHFKTKPTNPFTNKNENQTSPSPTPVSSLSTYNFSGTVTAISGNTLSVTTLVGDKNVPPQVAGPKPKTVIVTILPNADISALTSTGLSSTHLQNVKIGSNVEIFTKPDIDYSKTIYASKVEIMSDSPPAKKS